MKERSVPFSAHEVRATRAGRQTQFRRVVKFALNNFHLKWNERPGRPDKLLGDWGLSHVGDLVDGVLEFDIQTEVDDSVTQTIRCPYGKAGDRLWVKEAFTCTTEDEAMIYRADGERFYAETSVQRKWLWRKTVGQVIPSIHMPRWAGRIALEVVSVRVERVSDIRPLTDIPAEGVDPWEDYVGGRKCSVWQLKGRFRALWDLVNAKRGLGWDVNPWIWVVEYKLLEPQS